MKYGHNAALVVLLLRRRLAIRAREAKPRARKNRAFGKRNVTLVSPFARPSFVRDVRREMRLLLFVAVQYNVEVARNAVASIELDSKLNHLGMRVSNDKKGDYHG